MHSRTEKIDLNDIDGSLKKLDFSLMKLRGKSFVGEDLEFADFEGADLSGADFSLANLRCANLKNTKLEGTKFCSADLKFANLEGAIISNADFQKVDMEFANLLSAEIKDTDMSYVSMKHACFAGALIEGVDFAHSDADNTDFKYASLRDIWNPPYRSMACPSHGAFTGWMTGDYWAGEDRLLGAVIELLIPEDAIRVSNYNGVCRTNKAIVKSICAVYTYDYVDKATFRATNYEYASEAEWYDSDDKMTYTIELDEILTSEIDMDRFAGKRGIEFYIDKDEAIMEAYYMYEL